MKKSHHYHLLWVIVVVALVTSWKVGILPTGIISHQSPPRVEMNSHSNQPEDNDGLAVQMPVKDYAFHSSDGHTTVASMDPRGHGGVHLDLKFRELGDFPPVEVALAKAPQDSPLNPVSHDPAPSTEKELAHISAQGELWLGSQSLGKVVEPGRSIRLTFEPHQFSYVASDGTKQSLPRPDLLPANRVLVVTVRGDATRLRSKQGQDILRGVSKLRGSFVDEEVN